MSERVLNIGTQRFTRVVCTDEPGPGGACHAYVIERIDDGARSAEIEFQNGPIKENGVNGCHNEDLIAIVIDRLEHFQKGDFACVENAMALDKLNEALSILNDRTQSRIRRGVEGTSQK